MGCGNKKSVKKDSPNSLMVLAGIIARAHMRRTSTVRLAIKQKENVVSKKANS